MEPNEATYAIETDVPVEWHVDRLQVHEGLSESYLLECELRTMDQDPDPYELLGTNVKINVTRSAAGLTRCFQGIVQRVEKGATDVEQGQTGAKIHVVPAIVALDQGRNTRVFQNQTVVEIIQAVIGTGLEPYGRSINVSALTGTYLAREYCVQFRESDLAFASRLMEEEGIGYTFDHSGSTEVIVLTDANAQFARVETIGGATTISFRERSGPVATQEGIYEFEQATQLVPTSVQVRDYDWTHPGLPITAQQQGTDAQGRSREIFEHGGLTITQYDGQRYGSSSDAARVSVMAQRNQSRAMVCQGVGQLIKLAPGTHFELVNHPIHPELDGSYLVTRVLHHSAPAPEEKAATRYHNRFECVPLSTPWRPPATREKPRVTSVQTAIVVGHSGEEIDTDVHGRVKVQFHWDRLGSNDDTSSCFIRVVQSWAGPGWGALFLPRVGMEVVVSFIDGDPDRPVVTGCLYNADNPPPYTLPDDKAKSTVKSSTTPGGNGFNELRFDDAQGAEEIYVHAQRDFNEVIGHDHSTTVAHDQVQQVSGNQTETVTGNQSMTVNGDRTVHVAKTFTETIDQTETRIVTGKVTETLSGGVERTITGGLVDTITSGGETRNVTGAMSHTIVGDIGLSVTGNTTETLTGSFSRSSTGNMTFTTPTNLSLTGTGSVSISSESALTLSCPSGITTVTDNEQEAKTSAFSTGTFKGSAYVSGFDYTLAKLSITNLALSLIVSKIDLVDVKIDIAKFKYGNKPVEIKTLGEAIVMSVASIQTHGLTVFC